MPDEPHAGDRGASDRGGGGEAAAAAALATPIQRLAGALVDGAVLQVAALALVGLERAMAGAISTAVYLVYEVVPVAVRGQTAGKAALGTRVADDATGRLPSLWQAATRGVVPMAGVLVDTALGVAAVGALWVLVVYGWLLVDERRRGLHDRAAGTVVVALERSPAHRRAGAAAVAAAVVLTAALVAMALDDLEGQPSTGEVGSPSVPVPAR